MRHKTPSGEGQTGPHFRRHCHALCLRVIVPLALLCAYGFFGLYPFAFDFPEANGARRTEQGALVFEAPGVAAARSAPGWLRQAIAGHSIRIELEVRSFNDSQFGPARIFTLSRDYHHRNLTLGQQGADLDLRLRRPGSKVNGTPSFVVESVFRDDRIRKVKLLIERNIVQLAVDGVPRLSESFAGNVGSDWNADYLVAFGNEVIGQRPWLGEVRRATVAVDGVDIDYLNADVVTIPSSWWYAEQRLRRAAARPSVSHAAVADYVVNLIGFLPLGGLLIWLTGNRMSLFLGMSIAATCSLSIEAGQIFLPGRYPSAIDFGLNVLGALLGWLFVAWLYRRKPRRAAHTNCNRSRSRDVSIK